MSDCTKMRRMLVRRGSISMVPAVRGNSQAARGFVEQSREWVTEPCGSPLFSAAERESGLCRSCANGWSMPENYPADEEPPR